MSGEAKPGPAIGQALGPLGLNMADCKSINDWSFCTIANNVFGQQSVNKLMPLLQI